MTWRPKWVRAIAAAVIPVMAGGVIVTAQAQSQPAPLPVSAVFEVASVRRVTDPTAQIGARQMGGGRFSAVLTVRTLVQLAFGYPETLLQAQVVGGPSWIDNERFEINATYEGPIAIAPNSPPVRLLAMERALLADRFKLKLHQESRPLAVFDLVRSRPDRLGPKLVRSDGSCLPLPATAAPIADYTPYCGVKRSTRVAMSAKGIPMSRFARLLSFVPDVQRMVRDRTGLTEAFDLDLDYAPVGSAEAQDLPPIMTALKEQLGLELRPANGLVDVLVIDSVERPTPD
jgi:uncharacterized protein (TIGR03435 family)